MGIKLIADVGKIKRTIKSRVAFIEVLGQQLAQSDLYKSNPEVKAEADALVVLGQDLRASDTGVGVAEAQLDDAREDRGNKLIACDLGIGTFVAKVEQYATEVKDLTALALAAMERQHYKVETPLELSGQYHPAKLLIELEAKMPPGSAGCLIEVSTTPGDPASWKRVKGLTKQRALSGYAPGTYAFRATSVRGNEESDPTAPIMVVVT
jgi:hypothetical protein